MSFFLILHALVVVAFAIRILLRDDLSPPARLAWFIVLAVLPYVGSVVYFLFGEVHLGLQGSQRHEEIFGEIRSRAVRWMGRRQEGLIAPRFRPAFDYAASINRFEAMPGNRAQLMGDGGETGRRMVEDIDGAKYQVHVLYYIWLEDEMGTALAEALMRAARRGVRCRAMADGLGSRAIIGSELWWQMGEAGVELAVALPLANWLKVLLLSRIDLRNHRKITVIDGRVTYCGSRNSADPEFRVKAKYAPWVDIMLRFEGPVVGQNQLLFASDWMQATGQTLQEMELVEELGESKGVGGVGGFPAVVMGDGPTERKGATPQLFSSLITCAQEKLTLSTPYFVPDETVLEALCAAAYRGVRVRLIVPRCNDSWVVAAASRSYYRQLLEAGCVIEEFEGGLLHAKTLTVDGEVSLVGSSNLDLRSFDLNYENNILLQDEVTTGAIERRQQDYRERSRAVGLEEVLAWPWHRRIWHNVIATIGPIL